MKLPSRRRMGGLKPLTMISVLSFVLVSFFAVAVFAENDFDTPGITDNTLNIWNNAVETPDGDLAYMYDGAGKYPGLIRHLLKDALSGHIYQTRVKVYYQTPPAVVTVNTTGYSSMCYFKTNSPGTRLRMTIGATTVYDQMASTEAQRISARTEFWKYDGNTGNRTLRTPPTNNDYSDRNSRVCEDIGGEPYTTTIYRERCGLTGGDGTCNGADTDNNFSLGDYNSSTQTDSNPAISTGCSGGTCKFGDRSFAAAWAPDGVNMGYEPETGLYFANVNVTLSANNIQVEGFSNQIRFKLNAPGSYAIGHQRNHFSDANFTEKFGLGNQITVEDWQPNRGVKFALPFGPHCNSPASEQMTIGLYDADRGTFANTYMYVVERNPDTDARRRIPVTEFTGYSNVVPQTFRFIANTYSSVGPGSVSTITFNGQKGFQYMLIVVNPGNQPGQLNKPGQNVFSVALPTDSMPGIINCRYELEPYLNLYAATFENTPEFRLEGGVNNNKTGAVIGGDREWQVNKLVFSSKPAVEPGLIMNSGQSPCDRMRTGNSGFSPSCQLLSSQNYPGSNYWGQNPYTEATNYPAGSYICFMTSIRQPTWTSDPSQWAHSAMKCAVSVKFPSLAVSNGNVRTGGSFDTCRIGISSVPAANRHQYFGIVGHNYRGNTQHNYINGAGISTGAIQNIASLTNAIGSGNTNMRGHFARGGSTGVEGLFYGDIANAADTAPLGTGALSTHCLPAVFDSDRYDSSVSPAATPPGIVSPAPETGKTKTYTYALGGGILQLGAINLATDQRLIIRATGSGTVVLNGNITYSGGAANIWDLPQFTLLADGAINIVTTDAVSRLDGVYAGRGDFYTCQAYASKRWVAASECTSALRINGSVVVSGRLYPHRTTGHDSSTATSPAESFNLRPDVLLSDYADSPDNPGLLNTSQRELAPRY